MDFLDWFSEAGGEYVDYVGELFSEAGDGASEALSKLFSSEAPAPESLGGDGPVSLSTATDTLEQAPQITEETAVNAFKEAGSVENFAKWIEGLPSDAKKQFEKMLDNKLVMSGVAGGMKAALASRAQDKMLKAQNDQREDEQQFQTDTQARRGSVPTAIAKTRSRGLTEGYLKG
jgi:hypothetical protein